VCTELAPDRINGQGTEQAIGDTFSRCQPSFGCPTLRTVPDMHGRTTPP
jgi:hypothetical protein